MISKGRRNRNATNILLQHYITIWNMKLLTHKAYLLCDDWQTLGKVLEQIKPIKKGKIERNAPCPCGSGKKYKKCHGK